MAKARIRQSGDWRYRVSEITSTYIVPPAPPRSRVGAGGNVSTTKLPRTAFLLVRLKSPDQKQVHAVVHRGELGGAVPQIFHGQSKGPPRARIQRNLFDKVAVHGELDELTGLIGIRINCG